MKTMFLIRDLEYGGAQRQLVTLVRGLHACGYPVVVAAFYPGGALEKDLRAAGVSVHTLDKQYRWDVWGFLTRLIWLVRQQEPQVMYAFEGANLIASVLRFGFPHMRLIWSVRSSDLDARQYDWLRQVLSQVRGGLSRSAHLIIANSRAGLAYAADHGFPREKMVVIPNGIDTQRFAPDATAGRRVRAEWGVRDHEQLIGLVGRLDPVKDHPTFLRAAAILSQERDDVYFVCVGDGPIEYRQKLQALGEELGLAERLIWAGARYDMSAVYNALNLLTSTSSSEGFPNVICEAMACGIPCVATDAGDSRWIIDDTGIIVPIRSAEHLVEGWRTMLNIPRDSQRIRSCIVQNFGVDALIQRTAEMLTRTERVLCLS